MVMAIVIVMMNLVDDNDHDDDDLYIIGAVCGSVTKVIIFQLGA